MTAGSFNGLILYELFRIRSDELEQILLAGLACTLLAKVKALVESLGRRGGEAWGELDGLTHVLAQHFKVAMGLAIAQRKAQNALPMITASVIMGVTLAMAKVSLVRI